MFTIFIFVDIMFLFGVMQLSRPTSGISQQVSTVILADDLTGACDSAAVFAAHGRQTRMLMELEYLKKTQADVVSYSLETRNLSPQDTRLRIQGAAERIPGSADLLFCKIDSAGRGPIGAATLSLMDSAKCGWTILTPAFPDQGRIVRGGVLHLQENSGVVVPQASLKDQFHNISELISIIAVGNVEERKRHIASALNVGRRILIGDAETQEDLSTLVDAARQVNCGRVLWCGSAGLARALANLDFPPAASAQNRSFESGEICLVFAGTPHHVTAGQIEILTELEGVSQMNCELDAASCISGARCGVVMVKCGETTGDQIRSVWERAQSAGGIQGLILTGGDTASMVLHALRADSILLCGEVANGIPWGVVEGGLATGRRVVTKSGGFGARSALLDVVRFLEQTS